MVITAKLPHAVSLPMGPPAGSLWVACEVELDLISWSKTLVGQARSGNGFCYLLETG